MSVYEFNSFSVIFVMSFAPKSKAKNIYTFQSVLEIIKLYSKKYYVCNFSGSEFKDNNLK